MRRLGNTQALEIEQLAPRAEQAADAAVMVEQLAREVDRALAAHAGAQQHREQLSVAQRLGAEIEEPLARPLGGLPV